MITWNSQVYKPPTGIFFHNTRITKKICREFVHLTVLCDHPYLVSLLFAILLSLHLVTFLMLFIACLCHFFSSRRMPELQFAITQLHKSVLTRQHI